MTWLSETMSEKSLLFVWLDQRLGNLPGGNEKLKEKFRKLLSPIKQFDKPTNCFDYLRESTKEKQIFFITTNVFAQQEFLQSIASLSNVIHIFIYNKTTNEQYQFTQPILQQKIGDERIIRFDERLYEQIIIDLVHLEQNHADFLHKNKQNKEAKQSYQLALQYIDNIDDKDEDIQRIQQDLTNKINQIK